ncbi:hypothetical protein [Arthrobacter pityocampae]|uniref:hypothetical protein n=1 Tax=Arthrobacter pityocampae TaxID=547334 RepID=UPI003735B760
MSNGINAIKRAQAELAEAINNASRVTIQAHQEIADAQQRVLDAVSAEAAKA